MYACQIKKKDVYYPTGRVPHRKFGSHHMLTGWHHLFNRNCKHIKNAFKCNSLIAVIFSRFLLVTLVGVWAPIKKKKQNFKCSFFKQASRFSTLGKIRTTKTFTPIHFTHFLYKPNLINMDVCSDIISMVICSDMINMGLILRRFPTIIFFLK